MSFCAKSPRLFISSAVKTHSLIPRTGCCAGDLLVRDSRFSQLLNHTLHGTVLWFQTSKGRPVLAWMLVNNVEVFKTALRNTGWEGRGALRRT